jgi:acyl carrier protein
MVFEKIQEIIADQLEAEAAEITEDKNLMKDLEADSLDAVEIITAIEEEYDIEIPEEAAEEFTTVGSIVEYVEKLIAEK